MRLIFALPTSLVLALSICAAENPLPSNWRMFQQLTLEQTGFVRIALGPEIVNSARSDLADVRILGAGGEETPFLLGTPERASIRVQPVKKFTSVVQGRSTELQIETGLDLPIDALTIETPAQTFIKPVTVLASNDGQNWQSLTDGAPLFRLPNGSSETTLPLPPTSAKHLRVRIDDERSEPIPISGVRVRTLPADHTPARSFPVKVIDRQQSLTETRITIDLGAANLHLSSIELTPGEAFYTRSAEILVPGLRDNEIVEQQIASGEIRRIQLDSTIATENRRVLIERQIPSRTVTIALRNNDSPPLTITNVLAEYRPFTASLYAPRAGEYLVAAGNPHAAPPKYELNLRREDVGRLKITETRLGPLTVNPNYREPEILPEIADSGARIDLDPWKYRKQIQLPGAGIHQVQLDPETLSLAAAGLQDLRIVQNGAQVPYLLQRTRRSAPLVPRWHATNDTEKPNLSRWEIILPLKPLPLIHLSARVPNPLFERTVHLYALDENRSPQDRLFLASSTWTRKPGQTNATFSLAINQTAASERLLLETDNGDNPPITIQSLELSYPVVHLFFKSTGNGSLHLYFGNNEAHAPRYDLAIVADQILKAQKKEGALAALERLKPEARFHFSSQRTSILFWSVLIAVVAGLLFVISKLLPATPK